MRLSILYMCALAVILLACTKNDDIQEDSIRDVSNITWIVGANHSMDTTISVIQAEDQGHLSFDNYSICPNHELLVIVTSDDEVIYNQRIRDPNETITINSVAGEALHIQTKLVLADNLIYCVWLGQSTIRYEYNN